MYDMSSHKPSRFCGRKATCLLAFTSSHSAIRFNQAYLGNERVVRSCVRLRATEVVKVLIS